MKMRPHKMHLQCACAPSVNRSSVLNCFHPLAVAAIVARGFLARITMASVLDFRLHIHNGSEMRSRLLWERGAERRQTKPFSDFFFFFFATDGCVACRAVCDSCSVKENRAIVPSVIQGLTSLFSCVCECKSFYTSIGKTKVR